MNLYILSSLPSTNYQLYINSLLIILQENDSGSLHVFENLQKVRIRKHVFQFLRVSAVVRNKGNHLQVLQEEALPGEM